LVLPTPFAFPLGVGVGFGLPTPFAFPLGVGVGLGLLTPFAFPFGDGDGVGLGLATPTPLPLPLPLPFAPGVGVVAGQEVPSGAPGGVTPPGVGAIVESVAGAGPLGLRWSRESSAAASAADGAPIVAWAKF